MPNFDSLQPPGSDPSVSAIPQDSQTSVNFPFSAGHSITATRATFRRGRDGHWRACCRRGRDFRQQWQGRPIWAASTLRATGMGSGGSGDLAGPWVVSQYGFN